MPILEIAHIHKTYNHTPTLDDVSLEVEEGEILGLLGPSGSGKTTLLRVIAGLERADAGMVSFDGRDIAPVPPHLRRFGMMFQEYALFPHKNVFENVAFGLRMQQMPEGRLAGRVAEMLDLVGLKGFDRRNISELSGGERQRVALARSLAPYPRLLLLDEPFGSLDRPLREQLMVDVHRILKSLGITSILVTHDQAEALAVADLIAVIHQGRIEQLDKPETLHRSPATSFVASFLGLHNLLPGKVLPDGRIETSIGILSLSAAGKTPGTDVTILIRPEAGRLIADARECLPGETCLTGVIRDRLFRGLIYRVEIDTSSGRTLVFELAGETPPPPIGAPVHVAIRSAAVTLLRDRGASSGKSA